jgi:hypothetical protein
LDGRTEKDLACKRRGMCVWVTEILYSRYSLILCSLPMFVNAISTKYARGKFNTLKR